MLVPALQTKFKLEISLQSVEAAVAAENGGADRIELCLDLAAGGLTPREELMRQARARVNIPVFAMIRQRPGDFVYSDSEYEEMRRSIEVCKDLGMDGVVLGILTAGKMVDLCRTRELVEMAQPLPATFHRAFDLTAKLLESLEVVIETGVRRILTSGGAAGAFEGAEKLAELVRAAEGRIMIVPGAGLSTENITRVVQITGAREFHSGLSSALPYTSRDYTRFENEVKKLRRALDTETT
jgi:copper homeostasis protein